MLTLPQQFIDEMIEHARAEAPNECCGIIAGEDGRADVILSGDRASCPRQLNVAKESGVGQAFLSALPAACWR